MDSNANTDGSGNRLMKHRVSLPLSETQKKFYRMALTKDYNSLIKAGLQKYIPNGSNIAPILQKICIHPFLVPAFEEYSIKDQTTEKINQLVINGTQRYNYIINTIEKCKEQKERLVVICSLNEALDLLVDVLESKGHDIIIVNSKVKLNQRQTEISRFNASTDYCLIASAKLAPAFNINADKVIIHDFSSSDKELLLGEFNFINAAKVDVRCLLSQHSYEEMAFEKMIGPNNQSLWPEFGSVQNVNQNDPTPQDINSLLKFGAYETFKEEDIDQILERRVQSATSDPQFTFQKASFTQSETSPEIALNDPNFWEKILPANNTTNANSTEEKDQPDTRRYNTRRKSHK